VISNPPYVPEGDRDIGIEVRAHEPDHALFGGSDGLDILERLVEQSPEVVVEGGWLFVEIGAHQGDAVVERFEAAGYDEVAVRRDDGDHDRVVRGRTPGSRR
jgi:release factor glutamine methyltransferase